MITQTKYEVGFRDGFSNSSEWLIDELTNEDEAADHLLKVQIDGHRDIRLSFWEKEDGAWSCVDMYDEAACVRTGFLPQPDALVKQRGELK